LPQALLGRLSSVGAELAHTEQAFEFRAKAPMQVVAPLFGADKERLWATDWSPDFLWPAVAQDREGMAFTLARGRKTAIWVNTTFDLPGGRVQYVYVIPDTLVTVITLRLTPQENGTLVAVNYLRTALNAKANDLVRQMAAHDSVAGPEWEKQINAYLARMPKG
jgi:hypothetical protein